MVPTTSKIKMVININNSQQIQCFATDLFCGHVTKSIIYQGNVARLPIEKRMANCCFNQSQLFTVSTVQFSFVFYILNYLDITTIDTLAMVIHSQLFTFCQMNLVKEIMSSGDASVQFSVWKGLEFSFFPFSCPTKQCRINKSLLFAYVSITQQLKDLFFINASNKYMPYSVNQSSESQQPNLFSVFLNPGIIKIDPSVVF